jgi:hypothetical protein
MSLSGSSSAIVSHGTQVLIAPESRGLRGVQAVTTFRKSLAATLGAARFAITEGNSTKQEILLNEMHTLTILKKVRNFLLGTLPSFLL